jgi:hypothetical protein
MLFHEIYGSYFRAVAAILERSCAGALTGPDMTELVRQYAFGESVLTIPAALKDGAWPLLTPDMGTALRRAPSMPLTTLEKRWMKALLRDPRIRLFDPSPAGLEDVEPLYGPDTFVYFDRYGDGDPYEDEAYVRNFRTVLTALREKRLLKVRFLGHSGIRHSYTCVPRRLEYSAKDDKFRLLSTRDGKMLTINLARIRSIELLEPWSEAEYCPADFREKSLTMLLTDERNALERVMLHFSDLEKETEKLDNRHYRVTLWYKRDDETELLIRLLSFGPVLRVLEPKSMVHQMRERIERQFALQNSTKTANSAE